MAKQSEAAIAQQRSQPQQSAARLLAVTDELVVAVRELPPLRGPDGKKLTEQLRAATQTLRDLSAAGTAAFDEYTRAYSSPDGKPSIEIETFRTLILQAADEHDRIEQTGNKILKQ